VDRLGPRAARALSAGLSGGAFGTMTATMGEATKREKLEAEIVRLEGLCEQANKERARTPYLMGLLLGAPIAWLIWGPLGAATTVLGVVSLIATYFYLVEVRRREYAGEIRLVQRDLKTLELLGRSSP